MARGGFIGQVIRAASLGVYGKICSERCNEDFVHKAELWCEAGGGHEHSRA